MPSPTAPTPPAREALRALGLESRHVTALTRHGYTATDLLADPEDVLADLTLIQATHIRRVLDNAVEN